MIFINAIQKSIDRKGRGIPQKEDSRLGQVAGQEPIRPAEQAETVRRLLRREVKRLQLDTGRPACQPEAQRRRSLDFLIVADDGLAATAQEAAGRQPFLRVSANACAASAW